MDSTEFKIIDILQLSKKYNPKLEPSLGMIQEKCSICNCESKIGLQSEIFNPNGPIGIIMCCDNNECIQKVKKEVMLDAANKYSLPSTLTSDPPHFL